MRTKARLALQSTIWLGLAVRLAAATIPPRELPLSGDDWKIASFEPGQGLAHHAYGEGFPSAEAVAAIVPGDVHWDLERAGKLPPIYYGLNSRQIGWVAGKEWWYRKTFAAPPSWRGKTVRLQFEGVDYLADFWLNGVRLGRHEGQFTPLEFEVGKILRFDGENVLAVMIHPAPAAVFAATAGSEWGMMQAVRLTYPCWKSMTNAGWDWAQKSSPWASGKTCGWLPPRASAWTVRSLLPRLAPPYDRAALEIRMKASCRKAWGRRTGVPRALPDRGRAAGDRLARGDAGRRRGPGGLLDRRRPSATLVAQRLRQAASLRVGGHSPTDGRRRRAGSRPRDLRHPRLEDGCQSAGRRQHRVCRLCHGRGGGRIPCRSRRRN